MFFLKLLRVGWGRWDGVGGIEDVDADGAGVDGFYVGGRVVVGVKADDMMGNIDGGERGVQGMQWGGGEIGVSTGTGA